MATSGTLEFATPQSEQIIVEAYARIRVPRNEITGLQITEAERSINLELIDWPNRGINLWTVKREVLGLNPNQSTYNLPAGTVDIKTATLRTSIRNLGGTAFTSAGGNANAAFDSNTATACTQTAPNGYISYNWGAAQYPIAMVGIQSNATLTYTLTFEYSRDNVNWTAVYSPAAQVFTLGDLVWFVVPVPTNGNQFRVRETGGATLNIQELYFNTALNDTLITEISEFEWMSTPQKNQTGQPTSYYLDRQINPILILWPVPTPVYNTLFYSRIKQIEDIGTLLNTPDVPARFLDALSAGLAFRLSEKEPRMTINDINRLEARADKMYTRAAAADVENVPLRIYGDYTQGWSQV